MIDLKQRIHLRQTGIRIANILIALHQMFPHMRGLLRVYQLQRQLETTRQVAEDARLDAVAGAQTEVLPAIHLSTRVWLLGEDETPDMVEEERHTDPLQTRKLGCYADTEKRAAIRMEKQV